MVKSIEKGLTNLDNEVIFYDVADKIVVVVDGSNDSKKQFKQNSRAIFDKEVLANA